jgi:hypothetical protein
MRSKRVGLAKAQYFQNPGGFNANAEWEIDLVVAINGKVCTERFHCAPDFN